MEKIKGSMANKVQTIVIDNPPVNALDGHTLRELDQALAAAGVDPDVKVIVITGTGNFFAAGADIKLFAEIGKREVAQQLSEHGQRLMDRIENLGKPVIARINGICLGGGLELAMACHIRIAADTAQLGLPELRLGIIPGFGGSQRLPRLTNPEKAMEFILTGNKIDGQEACRIGLVSQSVPLEQLDDAVQRLTGQIAEKSLPAIRAALKVILAGLKDGMIRGLSLEAEEFGKRFESEDAHIGFQAFLEKRKPDFKDR